MAYTSNPKLPRLRMQAALMVRRGASTKEPQTRRGRENGESSCPAPPEPWLWRGEAGSVLGRDYGVTLSHHAVGTILRRAGLTDPKLRKRRAQRLLNEHPFAPGERGQLAVKHWKRAAYQYDSVNHSIEE